MNIQDLDIVTEVKNKSKQISINDIKETDKIKNNKKIGALTSIDEKDKSFYDKISDNEIDRSKEFKKDSYPLLKWVSCVGDPDWSKWNKKGAPPLTDNKYTEYYLEITNEISNINYFNLNNHPKLQYLLLTLSGVGKKVNHGWIGFSKKQNSKIEELIIKYYGYKKPDEINTIRNKLTKDELIQMCKDLGMNDKEMDEYIK